MSWVYGSGFIPTDGLNGAPPPWALPGASAGGPFPAGSPGYAATSFASDGFRPAWFGNAGSGDASATGSASTSPSTMMATIAQLLGQLQAQLTRLSSGFGSSAPSNGTAAFSNVSLSSTGDPHLGVNGTERTANGATTQVSSNFDSMASHDDLFSTHDFGDGFRVATTVTQPGANGITQNASATASMDGGRESVTLTNDGTLTVTDRGTNVALTQGQSVRLSGGATVTENQNGSVTIGESAFGRSLTTTFTANGGGGVDVTAQGQNVTLGGDLLTGGPAPVASMRVGEVPDGDAQRSNAAERLVHA